MRRLDLRQGIGRPRAAALPAADHIVRSDAQWAAVAALSAAALSGKIVEIQGSAFAGQLVMSTKALTAPLTMRGAPGNQVPSLKFTAMQKLTLRDINLQMPGWPASYGGCLEFFGVNAEIRIDGVSFRHGYGPGRIDLTPAGSSLCNARAEVGLSSYSADAFNCNGGTTIQNIESVNCTFQSVGKGVKALSNLITGRRQSGKTGLSGSKWT